MKKMIIIAGVLIAALAAIGIVYSQEAARMKATASEVTGTPELTRTGQAEGAALTNGMTVSEGDKVLTGVRESASLTFDDGSIAIIRPVSEITVTVCFLDKGVARTNLKLSFGAVRAYVPPREEKPSDFSITTPTVTCSVKGTEIKEVRANIDMPDTIEMGARGLLHVKRNPIMPLGANEATNSNLIRAIDSARLKKIVRQTQHGITKVENDADDESSIPLLTNPFDYMRGLRHGQHQSRQVNPLFIPVRIPSDSGYMGY